MHLKNDAHQEHSVTCLPELVMDNALRRCRLEPNFRDKAPENGLSKALFGQSNDRMNPILAVTTSFFPLLCSKNLRTRLK